MHFSKPAGVINATKQGIFATISMYQPLKPRGKYEEVPSLHAVKVSRSQLAWYIGVQEMWKREGQ